MKKALKDYSDTAIVIGIAIGFVLYMGVKIQHQNLKERWLKNGKSRKR
jgi:hypothetical protein|tara:strand:+ start:233 stop:376 length:144 start_codon:yes stop_codon:yes gene_type:complete